MEAAPVKISKLDVITKQQRRKLFLDGEGDPTPSFATGSLVSTPGSTLVSCLAPICKTSHTLLRPFQYNWGLVLPEQIMSLKICRIKVSFPRALVLPVHFSTAAFDILTDAGRRASLC